MERSGLVTFKGNPMTLVGPDIAVGTQAPDFTVTSNDVKDVKLSDFKGSVVVLVVVPSLDTGVCETETRKFNQEAGSLSGVNVLVVSNDLPFAQKRFCTTNGIDNVQTASDYKDHSFKQTWGGQIKELGLLARQVYVVDKTGKVVYRELVGEVAHEPDYAKALDAAKKAAAA